MSSVPAVAHTWDMDTIAKVRRLYSEAHVDMSLAQKPGALETTRDRLAEHFTQNARALAVEVNKGDLMFHRDELQFVPFTVRLRAYWEPTTNAVELRGGQPDGTIIAVQKVGEPLRIPVGRDFDWRTAGPGDFAPRDDILDYELIGWNEPERRWVYSLKA